MDLSYYETGVSIFDACTKWKEGGNEKKAKAIPTPKFHAMRLTGYVDVKH
jgi:hypothetical protein